MNCIKCGTVATAMECVQDGCHRCASQKRCMKCEELFPTSEILGGGLCQTCTAFQQVDEEGDPSPLRNLDESEAELVNTMGQMKGRKVERRAVVHWLKGRTKALGDCDEAALVLRLGVDIHNREHHKDPDNYNLTRDDIIPIARPTWTELNALLAAAGFGKHELTECLSTALIHMGNAQTAERVRQVARGLKLPYADQRYA